MIDIISVKPMMALSGVRSSWLMLATNCDLRSLASASCWLLSWISSNSRTFSMAITAWSAKVSTSSTFFETSGPICGKGSLHDQFCPKPAITLSKKDWHSGREPFFRCVTMGDTEVAGSAAIGGVSPL
jgi:hypothetical protein